MAWDPKRYLAFAAPRLQPGLDLMARIPDLPARRIVDLGCGTGFLTARLAERWPEARITGLDSSPEMLADAARDLPRRDWPRLDWRQADIADWQAPAPVDLIYSNAALHWLDGHPALFPHLLRQLAAGGVLAVQMPRNFDQPSHTLLREVVRSGSWADRVTIREEPVMAPERYYDLLAPHVDEIELWETEYLHVLSGEHPVLEWVRGTALLPVLEALSGDMLDAFLSDYAASLDRAYPRRADGRTLFPFRRLFLIARL